MHMLEQSRGVQATSKVKLQRQQHRGLLHQPKYAIQMLFPCPHAAPFMLPGKYWNVATGPPQGDEHFRCRMQQLHQLSEDRQEQSPCTCIELSRAAKTTQKASLASRETMQ